MKFHKRNVNEVEDNREGKLKIFSEKYTENEYLTVIDKQNYSFSVETKLLTVNRSVPEDEIIKSYAYCINEISKEKFKIVIGHIANRVDAQFLSVRRKSLSISNFVSDLLRIYMNTNCVILNSGSLRADSYINEGEITYYFNKIFYLVMKL